MSLNPKPKIIVVFCFWKGLKIRIKTGAEAEVKKELSATESFLAGCDNANWRAFLGFIPV